MDEGGDFLVVGGGIAGLRAAVELIGCGDVVVLTKSEPAESNTGHAQGGIAAALASDDSPERHARDTSAAGDGLCDPAAVRILVDEGRRYVLELMDWGARFDRDEAGQPALAREGAHDVRRVLHAKDATGREIARVLKDRVMGQGSVRLLKDTMALDAILEGGRCRGVRYLDAAGRMSEARARTTLLATGGAGQVFRETTNPWGATGDGIALAYRAGARVVDLEFVQFHPTVLHVEGAPRFLLSEALRGEGARLVNHQGEPFVARHDPAGDLAARDVVARAIIEETKRTGAPVYLSLAHLDAGFVHERFPTIAAACRRAGLDLARDPIPVSPAAHYVMGGVETDYDGRTSVPGLYAAGEVACTRAHGANRLASNSLLEGLVFGARAGRAMQGTVAPADLPAPVLRLLPVGGTPLDGGGTRPPGEEDVRALMWQTVGLVRTGPALQQTVRTLAAARHALGATPAGASPDCGADSWRRLNLLTVSWLVSRAAFRRQESRGAHYRSDHPARDDDRWRVHVSDVNEEVTAAAS